ncbi:hypothetical protein [Desulfovibrio sp. TomC]|uniref:hypothetical protein n=1 Tax=Desulfovibrio sp. TomC TaxID=1562888 RepID=UPI0005BA048E|nr:hypothetical protein [Desulfovibrio sp. TomC]
MNSTDMTRTVSKKTLNNLANLFIHKFQSNNGTKRKVDAKVVSKELNVTTALVDKIYIEAIRKGLVDVILISAKPDIDKHGQPYINSKGSLVIDKATIASLNRKLRANDKLSENDKFDIEVEGSLIILRKSYS